MDSVAMIASKYKALSVRLDEATLRLWAAVEARHLGRGGVSAAVSQRTVCDLLAKLGYSLQSTRKTREGGNHPDRDAQFQHIANRVAQYQTAGDPVISTLMRKMV